MTVNLVTPVHSYVFTSMANPPDGLNVIQPQPGTVYHQLDFGAYDPTIDGSALPVTANGGIIPGCLAVILAAAFRRRKIQSRRLADQTAG